LPEPPPDPDSFFDEGDDEEVEDEESLGVEEDALVPLSEDVLDFLA